MSETKRPAGMTAFIIILMGQIFSLLGTAMTNLGIPIWVYNQTHRATDLTVMQGLFTAALLVMSPFAGVWVDRLNRRLTMMLSDLAAGLVTVGILILYVTGHLQIWHLYVSVIIQGAFQTFQWPAFSAAITTMLPKKHYTRASTMLDTAGIAGFLFGPVMAGALLGTLGDERGLMLILLVDIVTATVAVGTLLFVHIPQPTTVSAEAEAARGSILKEAVFGFRYIFERPSLLGLQSVFLVGNFFSEIGFSLMVPMGLARTGNNELLVGSIQSIGAIGGLVGGVIISAWGGFKRRVHGVLLGWFLSGMMGMLVVGLGRPEPAWAGLPIWATGLFMELFISPLINGSNQGIWQAKVPPDMQGRVFSTRRMIAWLVSPLASFVAGPLADQVMEPAMREGGALADTFGWLVGSGPGAGMSLILVFMGILSSLAGLGGYLFPAIRNAEDLLPDHDMAEENAEAEEVPAS
jgi:DHA3 family macrolide efflux protein-like MFS transporter